MIDLSAEQRALLEGLARRRETSHSLVQRAQIVLRAADGEANTQIAAAVGLGEDAVGLWRRRWSQASAVLTAVAGQPKRLRAEVEQICQIIVRACEQPPPPLTHWTRQDLACERIARGMVTSISASSIGRFLKSGGSQSASHPLRAQSPHHR